MIGLQRTFVALGKEGVYLQYSLKNLVCCCCSSHCSAGYIADLKLGPLRTRQKPSRMGKVAGCVEQVQWRVQRLVPRDGHMQNVLA